jgi:hypothetical protein
MTTPVQAPPAGDREPGWSHDQANPYGPCYRRHVPGKGILRVAARGVRHGYAWYLSTSSPSEALSWARDGFAGPGDAMRDADRQVSRMPPRMFERLTPGEAQELYRRLARAHDWGHSQRDQTLGDVRHELFAQLQIQATDPSHCGSDPHRFIRAVQEASRGAALQAMAASPNRAAWIATRPRRDAMHGPAHPTEFPGPVVGPLPGSGGPAPSRRRAASTATRAGQARPRSLR